MHVIGSLRDHALASGNSSAAQRLDDEHSAADESRHTLLWSIEDGDQKAYAALAKALKIAKPKTAQAKSKARASKKKPLRKRS